MPRRRLALLLAALAGTTALLWWLLDHEPAGRAARKGESHAPARVTRATPPVTTLPALSTGVDRPAGPPRGRVVLRAGWGVGPGQLGRREAQESNPEAPMSLAVDGRGNVAVLDQVNRRVQRFDPTGKPLGSIPLTTDTAQDLLVEPDRVAVLDRLGQEPGLELVGADGSPLGRIPVVGGQVPEGGAITGLFSGPKGLYVETGHDDLVRVAGADGQPADLQETIPGRPSRDGKLFLKAGVIEKPEGRVYVQAHDAQLKLAWETPLNLGRPLLHLLLLDSDIKGNVYLGAEVGQEDPATHDFVDLATLVIRLDPAGHLDGVLELPPTTADAAETFRPLVIGDDGTVYHMVPSTAGVTVTAYRFQ